MLNHSESPANEAIQAGSLQEALAAVMQEAAVPAWMRQPNPAFRGMTPLQLIENGEVGRLWLMVHELGSGEPG